MKRLLSSLLACASVVMLATAAEAPAGSFKGTAGLQLYSLRDSFKTDVPGSLDKVKALGFTEVETAGHYGLGAGKLVALLKERGLTPVSGHFQYEPLSK